jgi:hypothetical protein
VSAVQDALVKFVAEKEKGKWQWGKECHEMLVLIRQHIMVPMLSEIINSTGHLHKIHNDWCGPEHRQTICRVSIWHEKEKGPGFWYNWRRFWCYWKWDVSVEWTGAVFAVSYFHTRAFLLADEIQHKYNELLRGTLGYDMALVNRS